MDLRFKVGHPKRYPIDWIFCSRRCQDCFHRLYAAGVRYLEREGALPTAADLGVGVIDPTEAELAAMQQCLKPLGEAASEIGMDRPLLSYTQQEALQLINAVVTTYVEAMVQEHERSKYPSVRMQLDAQPIN
ncbi:DUF6511 domain-containing protein [Limnohabitans lacus]|uniref:DUF6511 domain-containing protein n=1 Tax=Limnohabitans lacus TaxID=3045173 RepID=A0ABT6X8Y2_9BURK|nr:DUF6511 domain-containing protein [Limnohabitans sp. HM2-2]MDI9234597.1 DUF6511 domain-containing protein [Limnohabitans sp. HM2-2]